MLYTYVFIFIDLFSSSVNNNPQVGIISSILEIGKTEFQELSQELVGASEQLIHILYTLCGGRNYKNTDGFSTLDWLWPIHYSYLKKKNQDKTKHCLEIFRIPCCIPE